jgi:hypothetical protein
MKLFSIIMYHKTKFSLSCATDCTLWSAPNDWTVSWCSKTKWYTGMILSLLFVDLQLYNSIGWTASIQYVCLHEDSSSFKSFFLSCSRNSIKWRFVIARPFYIVNWFLLVIPPEMFFFSYLFIYLFFLSKEFRQLCMRNFYREIFAKCM